MTDSPPVKTYDAQQVSVGANFATDRYTLSILRHTRNGQAWHLVGVTSKQLRELARDITVVLAERAEAHRQAELEYETHRSSHPDAARIDLAALDT